MSRRSAPMLPPPPPTDRDVIMGPPPVPPQPLTPSSLQNSKDQREFSEKYYKLKRKYWELEEKYKDLEDELRRSGERNTNWNTERGMLLDRILELEASVARQPSTPSPHSPDTPLPTQPPTAFPRALQSAHAQTAFQANLQEAFDEIRNEDPSVDPLYTSRHIGPQARKRQLEEMKEREEEEARDARKTPRRGKAATAAPNSKAKDTGVPASFSPSTNNTGGPTTAPGISPQTLVAPSGKRIRIKPPTAAPPEPAPPLPRPAGQAMHRIPQFINNAGVPPTAHHLSPGSPMSPLGSDASHTPNHTGPGSPTSLGPSAASIPPTTVQRHTKPKRLKAHTVTSKSYSIPMVPRDKTGRPVLPLNVGIMTVNCLGEVCMREHFHTERYIFPWAIQRYLSARDPNAETVYNCTILDGGDGPKFQIIANDMADKPIIAGTATGAWSVVVRAANHVRNRQHSNSVSGPDFFGLGQNTIKHLIQELPGADRLKDYVWQNFVEGGSARPLGGRHATVVPALPDEYDSPNSIGERRGSRDSTSMDLTADGEPPISDVRGIPPSERPYSHARRDSRNSNGGPHWTISHRYLPIVMDMRHKILRTHRALYHP
ncbi:hypothetical protein EI94DRAFT_1805910 [Lactarius quietus]|nr:hypothetical protein EI94DRAFT_1805910 [Lactarius quietus]